jgi:hypothetical protein
LLILLALLERKQYFQLIKIENEEKHVGVDDQRAVFEKWKFPS